MIRLIHVHVHVHQSSVGCARRGVLRFSTWGALRRRAAVCGACFCASCCTQQARADGEGVTVYPRARRHNKRKIFKAASLSYGPEQLFSEHLSNDSCLKIMILLTLLYIPVKVNMIEAEPKNRAKAHLSQPRQAGTTSGFRPSSGRHPSLPVSKPAATTDGSIGKTYTSRKTAAQTALLLIIYCNVDGTTQRVRQAHSTNKNNLVRARFTSTSFFCTLKYLQLLLCARRL